MKCLTEKEIEQIKVQAQIEAYGEAIEICISQVSPVNRLIEKQNALKQSMEE